MISNSTAKAGPFACDGVQTAFDFTFPVQSASHVTVYLDDELVETGFTASGDMSGGRVTFASPPAAGAQLMLVRSVPLTQELDLQNHTAFLAEVIEGALDRLTMICQQLRDQVARAFLLPYSQTTYDPDEFYAMFRKLVDNGESWVEQAQDAAADAQAAAEEAADKVDTSLSTISNAGKGVIVDAATELDWDAAAEIPAVSTWYTASRAGIVTVAGALSSVGGHIRIAVSDGSQTNYYQSQINVDNSTIKSNSVWALVPKGCSYEVDYSTLDPLSRRHFIPFKNSIANS